MPKTRLSDAEARKLMENWFALAKDDQSGRQGWLEFYETCDLADVSSDLRSQVELVAQLNRRTMHIKEGKAETS